MRLTTVLLIASLMQVSAASLAQKITLNKSNAPLRTVLRELRTQGGVVFFYSDSMLQDAKPVNINVINTDLDDVLKLVFKDQPLTYSVNEKTITISKKESPSFLDKVVDAFTPPVDVRGVVLDEKGMPLGGVSIHIKGTSTYGKTDMEGKFYLAGVEADATIELSFIGYKKIELKVGEKAGDLGTIRLEQMVSDLDEIVVAYGKTTKQALTGAVTVVKGEQIENLPYLSVDKALQAVVPGLLVTQGTGQPGGGVSNFVLRGISTGGAAINGATSRNPLFVIDGVPVTQDPAQATTESITFNNPMAQLNPQDIESISVLKDAAAVALYGSKASNGVILVTTKKGKAGKTTFNFRHQTDLSERLGGKERILNQKQYLELLFETYKNTDPVKWTDAAILNDLAEKFTHQKDAQGNISFYTAPDWLNELYNRNAVTSSNNLTVSGGNNKTRFYLNLEYTDQKGVMKATGYDRKSGRLNYENRVNDWFKIGLNTTLSYNVQDFGSALSEQVVSSISPLNAIRDANGIYIYNYTWGLGQSEGVNLSEGGSFIANPAAAAELNINRNMSYRGLSNLSAELKFLKNFTVETNLGIDFMLTNTKQKTHPKLSNFSVGPGVGYILGNDLIRNSLISTNKLRYDFETDGHRIDILAAQEAQMITSEYKMIAKSGFADNPTNEQLFFQGTIRSAVGETSKQTLLSYFGQANYSYLNRYFLTGSLRTDGSSLFGDNKRFGTHWSAGGGWTPTSESFFSALAEGPLSYLKIRGSIGSAGNSSAIANTYRYDYLTLLGYRGQSAVAPNPFLSPGNPDIQWEKTLSYNLGIDMRLFKDRASITADFYKKKTTEVIATINLPLGSGFTDVYDNIGNLDNKGIELSLSVDVLRNKNFTWNLNSQWSANKNILVRSFLPLEWRQGTSIANGSGKNYASFYLPTWAGVNPNNGKPQWIDTLGKPNSEYSAAKFDFVGKPQPDGFGSLINTVRYRSLELTATFYYQYGFKLLNQGNGVGAMFANDGLQPYYNQSTEALDRWQKPGDIAANPRRLLFGRKSGESPDQSSSLSTRYLFDGDFIRLSNLILAYTFDRNLIQRFHLNGLRIFVQGNNLKTWTKYSGKDPENANYNGIANSNYPVSKSFSLGINVNF